MDKTLFDDFEVISTYSRKQAIEDGVLVDITKLAAEAGFRYPCAVTKSLFEFLNDTVGREWESFTGRAWDMLMIARLVAKRGGDTILFRPFFTTSRCRRPLPKVLKMVIGAGDDMEPVITFMFPDED